MKHCPKCRAGIGVNEVYCPNCGFKVKRKWWPYALVGVVIIIVILFSVGRTSTITTPGKSFKALSHEDISQGQAEELAIEYFKKVISSKWLPQASTEEEKKRIQEIMDNLYVVESIKKSDGWYVYAKPKGEGGAPVEIIVEAESSIILPPQFMEPLSKPQVKEVL